MKVIWCTFQKLSHLHLHLQPTPLTIQKELWHSKTRCSTTSLLILIQKRFKKWTCTCPLTKVPLTSKIDLFKIRTFNVFRRSMRQVNATVSTISRTRLSLIKSSQSNSVNSQTKELGRWCSTLYIFDQAIIKKSVEYSSTMEDLQDMRVDQFPFLTGRKVNKNSLLSRFKLIDPSKLSTRTATRDLSAESLTKKTMVLIPL